MNVVAMGYAYLVSPRCDQSCTLALPQTKHLNPVSRHGEASSKCLHALPDCCNLRVPLYRHHKVLQQLATGGLHLLAQLQSLVQELGHLLKVRLMQAARGHGGGADTHTAWVHGAQVAHHGILVECDVAQVARLLHLAAAHTLGPQVPQHQVVVSAASHQLVATSSQGLGQRTGVLLDLLGVGLELIRCCILEGHCQSTNLVIVGTTLQGGEDGEVDLVLVVIGGARSLTLGQAVSRLRAPPEEDHAGPWTTQGLVGGGGHHVRVLKGAGHQAGSHQTRDVGHV
mmetsp:Transcript_10268/g.22016  ORF Transcript_10268/g.22016 Transcript_10268/m.22016 type:complete len:284 (-) Transcript_10268:5-856(-)